MAKAAHKRGGRVAKGRRPAASTKRTTARTKAPRRRSSTATRSAHPDKLLDTLRSAYEASSRAIATQVAKALVTAGVRGDAAWAEAERLSEEYRDGNGGRHSWIFFGLNSLALSNAVEDALDPGPGDRPIPDDLPGKAFLVARHDVLCCLPDLHDMEVD